MKKLTLFLTATLVATTSALADNGPKDKQAILSQAAITNASTHAQRAKPVRLSDAELDRVTAGAALHLTGDGLTFVSNPGNAAVFHLKHLNIVCVNQGCI